MGSAGYNQYPWSSYDNKDCSLQLCSIYCPQFCYLIFPPPPPPEDDSGTPFSPLIIAIIGVLASALILISYYTIATRYCRRRNAHDSRTEDEENHHELSDDQCQNVSAGLDEGLIKSIKVEKYRKGDGVIEGSECAVCLCEFEENESLRLLPKCDHAFHLPCIDTWLKSHSNCPLCRANVVVLANHSPVVEMNSYETHQPEDLILVVDDQERISNEQFVCEYNAENPENRNDVYGKSVCLGGFSCQRQLMISDILRIEEIDEDLLVENFRSCREIGSSMGLQRSPVSSSRLVFNMNHDKGKNSIDIGQE